MKRSLLLLLLFFIAGSARILAQPHVVIQEIYGGGGNVGSIYRNDYVVLYNQASTTASISGWTIQWAGAGTTTWQATPINGTIAPKAYYLIQLSQGTTPSAFLPTPDAIGTLTLGQTSGKIVLCNSTASVAGLTPVGANIVDFVGYGSGTPYEGTGPTPTPSNILSAQRLQGGDVDTNNNQADFVVAAPSPKNSLSPPNVTSTPQTINFQSLSNSTFGNFPFLLNATASSGLPVTFTSSDTTIASISGNIATVRGAGDCIITAHQSGNTTFSAAPDVPLPLHVYKAHQQITFNEITPRLVGDPPILLDAFSDSGLPVTYSSENPAIASINGNQIIIQQAGVVNIHAIQSGNSNFLPADVAVSLTISPFIPSAPTLFSITSQGFTATWQILPLADHYQLEISSNSFVSFTIYSTISNNYAVTGLTPGTTYLVRLRAIHLTNISQPGPAAPPITIPNNLITWHLDNDGDGYGSPQIVQDAASQPVGWVLDGTDCNDHQAATHPGQLDLCDNIDNDCDGTTDEDCDLPAPTMASKNIVFSNINENDMTISFTPGNGAGRIVVLREGAAVNWAPADSIHYGGNNFFEEADDQGNGNKVVMSGSGTSVFVFGLKPSTTYYAKVFENNETGLIRYLVTGAPSKSAKTKATTFTYVTMPSDNAINQNVTLNLMANTVIGATMYTLEINESPEFTGTGQTKFGSKTQSFSGLSYSTQYFARAKANNSSDWGDVTSFTTGSPENFAFMTAPANNAVNVGVTASVTSGMVIGATTYTLEVNSDPAFQSPTAMTKSGAKTQSFTGLAFATTYYVRVKTDLSPNWGPSKMFTTGDPVDLSYVTSPANNATKQLWTLSIKVNSLPGATDYAVQLSPVSDFSSGLINGQSATNSIAFTGLAYNTKYYARVNSSLSHEWGPVRSFTTGDPVSLAYITAPANNATNVNGAVTITANSLPGATSYDFMLSTNPTFEGITFQQSSAIKSSVFTGLSFNTTYYGRVRTNLSEEWGAARQFTTGTPSSLAYVSSPANSATNSLWTLDITANSVLGASTYTIELNTDADFGGSGFVQSAATNKIHFSGLEYDTKYYNRVKTNLDEAWGQVRSFTTSNPAHFSYLTSPAAGATNVNWIVNLVSANVPDATSYTIEANPDPEFDPETAIVKTEETKTIGFILDQNVLYYTRVKTNLSPIWGISKSFTTGTAVSLAYVTSPKAGGTGVPQNVTVTANALTGATSYTIEVNPDAHFLSGYAIVKTLNKRSIAFTNLAPSKLYYVRVQTDLAPGQWGPTTTFTTINPAARGGEDWKGEDQGEEINFEPVNLIVYGNPFHDRLKFLIETPDQREATVMLYDLTGKQVHSSIAKTNSVLEIETPYSEGIYLLRVQTEGDMKVERVLKLN